MPLILVTSAAGGAGRPLVRALIAAGFEVRAFVKNDEQAARARADGATDIVIGDLRQAGDLEGAVRGVQQIFHAAPTQLIDEVPVAERLIAAAQAEGATFEHLVFQSVIHPEIAALPHHAQKARVEALLQASGLPVTVLRPSHYMQNVLDFWDFFGAGLLPYPTSPERRMGVVDAADIAAATVRVLAAPAAHVGQTYDLSTVELTRHDMAAIWARVLGHPMTAIRLPPETLTQPLAAVGPFGVALARTLFSTRAAQALPHIYRGLRSAPQARGFNQWPKDAQDTYVTMMRYYDGHGLPAGNLGDLHKVLGRPGTSYEEFARRVAAAAAAS